MDALERSRAAVPTIEAAVPWVMLTALAIGAADRRLAIAVLAALALGYVIARPGSTLRRATAGLLPAAFVLSWGGLAAPRAALDGSDCLNPLSPPAAWRALEAVAGLALVGFLARSSGISRGGLGFVRPDRRQALLALGLLAGGAAALVAIAGLLASPFFGPFAYAVPSAVVIVPALLFAVSNATVEEVAYRSAARGWLAPLIGATPAILASAVVFSIAHTGRDFIASPVPVMLAMFLGAVLAGVVLRRTGSLTLLLAVHVAADVPVYLYWACRAT